MWDVAEMNPVTTMFDFNIDRGTQVLLYFICWGFWLGDFLQGLQVAPVFIMTHVCCGNSSGHLLYGAPTRYLDITCSDTVFSCLHLLSLTYGRSFAPYIVAHSVKETNGCLFRLAVDARQRNTIVYTRWRHWHCLLLVFSNFFTKIIRHCTKPDGINSNYLRGNIIISDTIKFVKILL